jgi:hypothetical protein
MLAAYIYIRGSYFLIKQKMNKSKKNTYIKFSMPVAKRTAECASQCCLEGILNAWDFIKGFYSYEYVFWRLKQFFFPEFGQFHH